MEVKPTILDCGFHNASLRVEVHCGVYAKMFLQLNIEVR